MIELKNLYKTYIPNKETKVNALQDVNLTFGDRGLVFLLGKSGSGKTTLLNMIGGLDKPTQGQILIDGKELNVNTEREINSYRNNNVGFVFQNYGLLEDLTVKNNIKLALELQNTRNKTKKIKEILEVVGLTQCMDKKVSRLSGGQKQRVAIARALIKDSKIILADEPTGNLDEQNSKEIFELLKRIAQDRVVIVVTHSQKFAQQYAQRIITLKDGKILDDVVNEQVEYEREVKSKTAKNKFPLSTSLRFALGSIWHVKARFLLTLIFLVVSLTMFGAGLSATRYNKYDFFGKAMQDNHVNGYTVMNKMYEDGIRMALQPEQMSGIQQEDSLLTYYVEKFMFCYDQTELVRLNSEKYFYPDSVAVFDIDKLKKQGIELFRGKAPTKMEEIVLTKYFAEGLMEDEKFKEFYGVKIIEDLLGKTIQVTSYNNDYYGRVEAGLKVVGIVDAHINYEKMASLDSDMRATYAAEGLNRTLFLSKEFFEKTVDNQIAVRGSVEIYKGTYFYGYNGALILYDSERVKRNITVLKQSTINEEMCGSKIMWKEGHDKTLSEDEIIVTPNIFGGIYNYQNNKLEFTMRGDYDEGKHMPIINEGFECEIAFGEETKTVKVVGLINYGSYMLVSDDLQLPKVTPPIKSMSATFGQDKSIEATLRNFDDNEVTMVGDLQTALQKASTQISPIVTFGIIGFGLFGLFAIMMLSSFVSSMIEDNYKQLGVLRALGASRGNLIGIYLLVATILVLLCNIIAMPLLPRVKQFMQAKEINEIASNYIVFETLWYDYLIMLAMSVGITFVGSIVHILSKTKATPIEMLRGKSS